MIKIYDEGENEQLFNKRDSKECFCYVVSYTCQQLWKRKF